MKKIKIRPTDFHMNIPEKPGVYRIYSLDQNNKPKPIQRVLSIDKSGILYIGRSNNIRDRLRMLWRVLTPDYKATAHTFGINYNTLKIIRRAFPLNTLAIDYEINSSPKYYEKLLLERYRQKFGEVPPLNGSK